MVVVDDDEPLSGSTHKTLVKKAKTYTSAEQNTLDRLFLWLKSEGRNCQYSKEMTNLVKYQNENVPNLRQALNTDDHSAHLTTMIMEIMELPGQGKSADGKAISLGFARVWGPGEDPAQEQDALGQRDAWDSSG